MFEKLFAKKPKEKAVVKFWKEFESRAELYADILAEGDEESEDFLWLNGLVGKALKLCCLVFHHMEDGYLRQVAALLQAHYPPSLEGCIGFTAVP